MQIELKEITIRELTHGYEDRGDKGVRGYSGRLDIRPPYQREFIYGEKERDAVITTLRRGFPLNVMYWAVRSDGTFEVMDGQQRTLSICQYVAGDFAYEFRYFHNLLHEEKEQILSYRLMVYVCSGTDTEKLDWFRTINIAGKALTEQELLNAVYAGSFLTDAKRHFSKNGCPAYRVAGRLLTGSAIRQEYLETALLWMARHEGQNRVEPYLAAHQHDAAATNLWVYFRSVTDWVGLTFPHYRKEMKGVDWGALYEAHGQEVLDAAQLEQEVKRLMADSDVTNKRGIYPYVLNGNERSLNIRAFDDNMKREVYERQEGRCPLCGRHFTIEEMQGDHIVPWSRGGHTVASNCQMLCRECNNRKSDK